MDDRKGSSQIHQNYACPLFEYIKDIYIYIYIFLRFYKIIFFIYLSNKYTFMHT